MSEEDLAQQAADMSPEDVLVRLSKQWASECQEWARRYDDAVQPLQRQCSEYLVRAEQAEADLFHHQRMREASVGYQSKMADEIARLRAVVAEMRAAIQTRIRLDEDDDVRIRGEYQRHLPLPSGQSCLCELCAALARAAAEGEGT